MLLCKSFPAVRRDSDEQGVDPGKLDRHKDVFVEDAARRKVRAALTAKWKEILEHIVEQIIFEDEGTTFEKRTMILFFSIEETLNVVTGR